MSLDSFVKGKAYFAALGLVGLAVYQASLGHFDEAIQALFSGFAAFAAAWGYAVPQVVDKKSV